MTQVSLNGCLLFLIVLFFCETLSEPHHVACLSSLNPEQTNADIRDKVSKKISLKVLIAQVQLPKCFAVLCIRTSAEQQLSYRMNNRACFRGAERPWRDILYRTKNS